MGFTSFIGAGAAAALDTDPDAMEVTPNRSDYRRVGMQSASRPRLRTRDRAAYRIARHPLAAPLDEYGTPIRRGPARTK